MRGIRFKIWSDSDGAALDKGFAKDEKEFAKRMRELVNKLG